MKRLDGYYAVIHKDDTKELLYFDNDSFYSAEDNDAWYHENQLKWVSAERLDIDVLVDSVIEKELS